MCSPLLLLDTCCFSFDVQLGIPVGHSPGRVSRLMAVQRSMKAAISILDKSSTNTGNCKRQLSAVKQAVMRAYAGASEVHEI